MKTLQCGLHTATCLKDTIPTSDKGLITIWPMTLTLLAGSDLGGRGLCGEKHNGKGSQEIIKMSCACPLSLSLFLFPLLLSSQLLAVQQEDG